MLCSPNGTMEQYHSLTAIGQGSRYASYKYWKNTRNIAGLYKGINSPARKHRPMNINTEQMATTYVNHISSMDSIALKLFVLKQGLWLQWINFAEAVWEISNYRTNCSVIWWVGQEAKWYRSLALCVCVCLSAKYCVPEELLNVIMMIWILYFDQRF